MREHDRAGLRPRDRAARFDRVGRATVTVPTVTVFGAGITGLSVAHELVERGFRVQVVEREPGSRGADACEVGGMARTQVVRLPTLADPDPVEQQAKLILFRRELQGEIRRAMQGRHGGGKRGQKATGAAEEP